MAVEPDELIKAGQAALRAEALAVLELVAELDSSFVNVVQLLLECRGHVVVSGVGTTGMIGRRLAHLLCCVGCPSLFLHAADSLHGSSGALRPEDLVVLLSKGGESQETVQLAEIARARGTPVVTLTAQPDSTLARLSRAVLVVGSPDAIDPFGLMSLGSSLVMAAMCDALVAAVLAAHGTQVEEFARLHPGGIMSHLPLAERKVQE